MDVAHEEPALPQAPNHIVDLGWASADQAAELARERIIELCAVGE